MNISIFIKTTLGWSQLFKSVGIPTCAYEYLANSRLKRLTKTIGQ